MILSLFGFGLWLSKKVLDPLLENGIKAFRSFCAALIGGTIWFFVARIVDVEYPHTRYWGILPIGWHVRVQWFSPYSAYWFQVLCRGFLAVIVSAVAGYLLLWVWILTGKLLHFAMYGPVQKSNATQTMLLKI